MVPSQVIQHQQPDHNMADQEALQPYEYMKVLPYIASGDDPRKWQDIQEQIQRG